MWAPQVILGSFFKLFIMIHKICGHCKKEYPATLEYFHKKVTKAGTLIHGRPLKNDCVSLRHICKSCHLINIKSKKHIARAKELNLSLEEYQVNIKRIQAEAISLKNLKYLEYKDLDPTERALKLRRIRLGYTLEEVDNYDTLWREKHKAAVISRRKYEYVGEENTYPLNKKLVSKKMRELHAPSIIALNLAISVKDLTPELLELGIKSINLKRQLKTQKHGNS